MAPLPPAVVACGPMRFEHMGPEDASGPPFAIEIGIPAGSSDTRWLVTLAVCMRIHAHVMRHGSPRQPHDEPAGTFSITGAGAATRLLPPGAMQTMLQILRHAYLCAKVAPPAMLEIQENLLRAAKAKNPAKS